MSRRTIPVGHKLLAFSLYSHGENSGAAIARVLIDRYGNEAVDERTVRRWLKSFAKVLQRTQRIDEPFDWRRMDDYGIPWSRSELLLDLSLFLQVNGAIKSNRAQVATSRIIRAHGLKEFNRKFESEFVNHSVVQLPRLSGREAIWAWRVQETIGQFQGVVETKLWRIDILSVARALATREIISEIWGGADDMADIQAWLHYRPWQQWPEDSSRAKRYEDSIADGVIPRLKERPSIVIGAAKHDWNRKDLEAALLTSQWPSENAHGPIWMLASQQLERREARRY